MFCISEWYQHIFKIGKKTLRLPVPSADCVRQANIKLKLTMCDFSKAKSTT